jgi:hypothetical protein
MTFGLSVHNAAAALYSIARADTSATSTVAAGRDSLPEGVLEACGLLGAGAPQVLLVAYDDVLPPAFGAYADAGDRPAALGLVLEPAGERSYALELSPSKEEPELPPSEPQVASVARFLKDAGRELEILSGARRWLWSRA